MLRIDRVAMGSKGDRAHYSRKSPSPGVNVQAIADPAGRLIWASPAVPGARHDAGAEPGVGQALADANITAYADTAYHATDTTVRVPYRRVRYDRTTRKLFHRSLSPGKKTVNRAHSRLRAPGERANAELKNRRILRKIRSSPAYVTFLVNAVQVLIIKG